MENNKGKIDEIDDQKICNALMNYNDACNITGLSGFTSNDLLIMNNCMEDTSTNPEKQESFEKLCVIASAIRKLWADQEKEKNTGNHVKSYWFPRFTVNDNNYFELLRPEKQEGNIIQIPAILLVPDAYLANWFGTYFKDTWAGYLF